MTVDSKHNSTSASRKLGAREVVELLRRNLDEQLPEQLVVTQNRHQKALMSLLKLLSLFQGKIAKSPYANASVRSLLVNYLLQKHQVLHISQPDLGAITLIDSMFDKLLDSGKFDKDAWCLLVQTRLPITKCALQDYSFFFAGKNPGRRFLNSLTLNLLGAGDRSSDEFRQAIGGFVDQINQNYHEDIGEFNKVCIVAQSWFADQQQRLVNIQTKLRDAENNRKAQSQAEPRVVELLNRVAGGKMLPDLLVDFIYGDWRDVLRIVSMRDGEQSTDWKRLVRLTETMVDMVSACETPEGQQQYQKFLPSMLKTLRSLMKLVFEKPAALEKSLEPVELILNALVCGAQGDLKQAPMLQVNQQLGKEYEIVPELGASGKKLQNLQVGDWLRLKTSVGVFEACKITVKGEGEQPWILVNHSGKKVAKKNLRQLAKGLNDGVVEIVGDGRWVDDILITCLTELSKRPPAARVDNITVAPDPPVEKTKAPADEHQIRKQPDQVNRGQPTAPPQDEPPAKDSPAEPGGESLSLATPEEQRSTPLTPPGKQASQLDEILKHSDLSLESTEPERATQEESSSEPHKEDAQELVPSLAELESALESSQNEADPSSDNSPAEPGETHWNEYVAEPRQLTDEELAVASEAARQLSVGGWINLVQEDGTELRCKLAARVKTTGIFIFVNRLGAKKLETTESELAELIARGDVTIVDNGLNFDSTLERVVMNIQAEKK